MDDDDVFDLKVPNNLVIKDNIPFSVDQQVWIQGYLAGLRAQLNNSTLAQDDKDLTVLDILYGTQTGSAESIAQDMSQVAKDAGMVPAVRALDDIDMAMFSKMENVAIVTSTYGEGEMPDNAQIFWEKLCESTAPKLDKMKFSVLGLGDTSYEEFCHAGKLLDTRLEQLGAKRIEQRVDCDVDFDAQAEKWISQVVSKWKPVFTENVKEVIEDTHKKYVPVTYNRKNPYPAKLLRSRLLSGKNSAKEIVHYEIGLGDSGLTYEVGDSISIFPTNKKSLVNSIINRLGVENNTVPEGFEETIETLLTEKYEILTPSKRLIEHVANKSDDKVLKKLVDGGDKKAIEDYKWGMDVLDFMNIDPNLKFDIPEFLSLCQLLQHRAYSISSSMNKHDKEVHLTVSTVRWKKDDRNYNGVCSSFLADDVEFGGELKVFFMPNKSFRLPDDDKDIIMIGPGTGIAPFRAFLQEREVRKSKGKNWLFFGDQTRSDDFIYKSELAKYTMSGLLSRLDLAFSRDQKEKIYVQHKMYENKQMFYDWLENGAYIYVCGDATRMAKDVEDMILQIVNECSSNDSKDYLTKLKKEKRYLRDVY